MCGSAAYFFAGIVAASCFSSLATGNPYTVKLQKHSIPLFSDGGVVQHKSAYFGEINVGGSDRQSFQVVFDTGSGHLVLPSAMCKTETCKKHKRYKRKASIYAEDIDADGTVVLPGQPRDQITVSFGTGQVTGIFVRDLVCLGEADEPRAIQANAFFQTKTAALKGALPEEDTENMTGIVTTNFEDHELPLQHQSAQSSDEPADRRKIREHGCLPLHLIAATKMTDDPFAEFPFDGILGLGLRALSQTPDFSFINKGSLPDTGAWMGRPKEFQRSFSVFLAVGKEEDSEITFGGYDPTRMREGAEFIWSPVQDTDLGYWQIEIKAILIDGQKIDYCDDGTCRAIVDTGTSLLAVPSNAGVYMVEKLRHQGKPGMGCTGSGPVLEFDLGDIILKLEPKDIARPEVASGDAGFAERSVGSQVVMEESVAVDSWMSSENSTVQTCIPMLMYMDLPEPLSPKTFILGEPVLQQYYTAFDMGPESPRVGFTSAVHRAPRDALRIFT